MFRRILRSTIVLAALIGAYQAYVTFAVPRMEPPLEVREQRAADREELDRAAQSVSTYQRLLSHYFPQGHWTQVRPPKIFANGTETTMLVIDEYTRRPVGGGENQQLTQVDIKRMAMLMFPTPPQHDGVLAPRDAIVLEAPQGAHLLFDDFHPEMGRIGQITRGEFPGPITIRSDMHDPGPDDDLLVETSDLKMNTKLLYTDQPVKFRMGQNVGGGRELEIRFLSDEHVQPRDQGLKIAGFDSLEIRRDVRMRMQLNTSSLLPGGDTPAGPSSHAPRGNEGHSVQQNEAPKPPVDVTCNGPFTFDFVRYVASVDRDVVVRQVNPNGPCDQLDCNQLDIRFKPKVVPDAKPEPVVVDPGKRQQRDLGRLEASMIIAQGHPAIAVSPQQKAEARGDRIQILLQEQRVRIDGGNDAMVSSGPNVLHAPVIDYQRPDPKSASKIGQFFATGPGSLHYVSDPTKPNEVFQAAWQQSIQLSRDKGQPVIVMEGRPELAFAAAGSILGDQIRLYLRELNPKPAAGPPIGAAGSSPKQSNLAPDRLIAVGNVEIASPQLTGHTHQLLANFTVQPQIPPAATDAGKVSPANPAGSAKPAGAATPAGAKREPANDQSQQVYHVVADQMRLEAFFRDQKAVPNTLACDGNVVLQEVPQAGAGQPQPLDLRGARLFVEHLDTKTPHITLRGAGATGSAGAGANTGRAGATQLAQLSGRGVTLLVDWVEMEGRDNHMWSDGPGEATMLMTRDMQGNATATPTPLKIHWQGGLQFDGQTITFDRDVIVASADSTLRCNRMLAKLAAPIQFGQHVQQTATSLNQVDFEGEVNIENVSRDTGGVTSHDRMELRHLTVNQQTGAISGEGPGVIRSTRYGAGLGPMAGPQPNQAPDAAPPGDSGNKLHFLRVDFHTGLDGNMFTREMTFHDRVRAVYGPVDSWEQELELTRPESLPPESMTLTCDDLRLNEDPLAAHAAAKPNNQSGPQIDAVQMQAKGDVRIEGQTLSQGDFSIQADRASYDKTKDVFILEGNTRTPAKLWRRKAGVGDNPPLEARKIYYNRKNDQTKVEGVQFLEFEPGDIQRPTAKAKANPQR